MSECSKEINISNNDPYVIKHDDGSYTIYSGLPEFGYELLSAIPLAWHLHQKGLLRRTISGYDTKVLYWFSPQHDELDEPRSYDNVKKLQEAAFPNIEIHRKQLDWGLFSPPPYKGRYQSDAIQFAKPTLIISNRINSEWNGEPINFLNVDTLNDIFALLREKYQIIYLETSHFSTKYEDHSEFDRFSNRMQGLNLSGVITFSELLKQHPGTSINELQLRLYAGCEKFISSNGGLGILASYFGGENIIFSKRCHELNPDINSFYGWYPRLSGATISVARSEPELLARIHGKWVDDLPLFNILIRTSGRPNYFHDCIISIIDQDYKNVNIIVGYDDPASEKYIRKFPCLRIPLQRWDKEIPVQPIGEQYGIWFPFNEYFNYLLPYAKQGYVLYLDDDDCFVDSTALSKLAEIIKKQHADTIFWRVQFPDRLVPGEKNWELKKPINRDMSTIGFCHNSKNIPEWEPWKRGDYRVANFLYRNSNKVIWFNKILTGLQRVVADGYGKCDDKERINVKRRPSVTVIIPAFKSQETIEQCIDSIYRQNVDFPICIFVGVDYCMETLKIAQSLMRKYDFRVQFYRSKKNVGPYIIKNSLIGKIARRDSLVITFDSDDLMPDDFLQKYYDYYISLPIGEVGRGILKSSFINWYEDKYNYNDLKVVKGVVIKGCSSNIAELYKLRNRFCLDHRYKKKTSELRQILFPSVGVLIFDYISAEILGFYSEFKVAQDSDFIERAALLKVPVMYDSKCPWYIRRVSGESLEFSVETGMGSKFRNEIKKENRRRIDSGILVAKNKKIALSPIL